ncbi:MAG: SAM-dependent methyltransferase [Ghiorsea sp.]|nr:SAM-dependent methyltransferase [Ghiorsea sp.]
MNNEHQRLYALTEHILHMMQTNGGAISFHDWMQAALYQPKLGYYESKKIFGAKGDFTTASAMGDWLAMGFADTIIKAWHTLGQPQQWTLLEQGGGNGNLLCQILKQLEILGVTPPHLISIEISEQLRQRQQNSYEKHGLSVQTYPDLPSVPPIENLVMLSNELPDAFPVQAFIHQQGKNMERGVDWIDHQFVWLALEAVNIPVAAHIQEQWPDGYCSEFNPHLQSWQQAIADICQRAVILTVDYGYTQQEYYRQQRMEGTLMGHYQHQVVEDVLKLSPGVCDMTAHVDFSALQQAGESVGLQSIAYTTQGAWLAQTQLIQTQMQTLAANPNMENFAQITNAKRLMLPNGMGESFKLLIQVKGLNQDNSQNLVSPRFDRLHTL